MIVISKKYIFDSAHQLHRDMWSEEENKKVFGKCNRLHGHTYELEVFVTGDVNPDNGMIVNFFDLDNFMKPLVEVLDHEFLNELDWFAGMLTTSENMVRYLATVIKQECIQRGIRLIEVRLSETAKTKAIWTNMPQLRSEI